MTAAGMPPAFHGKDCARTLLTLSRQVFRRLRQRRQLRTLHADLPLPDTSPRRNKTCTLPSRIHAAKVRMEEYRPVFSLPEEFISSSDSSRHFATP